MTIPLSLSVFSFKIYITLALKNLKIIDLSQSHFIFVYKYDIFLTK